MDGKGVGLGLSISFGIVKEHGGDISVSSEKGEGTTFIIRLPVTPPPADPQKELRLILHGSDRAVHRDESGGKI